jgi:hypothetical protein
VLCNSSSVEGRLTRDKRKEALTQAMARDEEQKKVDAKRRSHFEKEKEDFLFFTLY